VKIKLSTHMLLPTLFLFLSGISLCSEKNSKNVKLARVSGPKKYEKIKPIKFDYFTPTIKAALCPTWDKTKFALVGGAIGGFSSLMPASLCAESGYNKTATTILFGLSTIGFACIFLYPWIKIDIERLKWNMEELEGESRNIACLYNEANKYINDHNIVYLAQFLLDPGKLETIPEIKDFKRLCTFYKQHSVQPHFVNTNHNLLSDENIKKVKEFNQEIRTRYNPESNINIISSAHKTLEFKKVEKFFEIQSFVNTWPPQIQFIHQLIKEKKFIEEYHAIHVKSEFDSFFTPFTRHTLSTKTIEKKLTSYQTVLKKIHSSVKNAQQIKEQVNYYRDILLIYNCLQYYLDYCSQEDIDTISAGVFKQSFNTNTLYEKIRLYSKEIAQKEGVLSGYLKIISGNNRAKQLLSEDEIFKKINATTIEWYIQPHDESFTHSSIITHC